MDADWVANDDLMPEYDWETIGYKVNEGAAFLRKGNLVFLSYSASATDFNYCMGLLEADADADLLDATSWRKSQRAVSRQMRASQCMVPVIIPSRCQRTTKRRYLCFTQERTRTL